MILFTIFFFRHGNFHAFEVLNSSEFPHDCVQVFSGDLKKYIIKGHNKQVRDVLHTAAGLKYYFLEQQLHNVQTGILLKL